MERKIVTIEKIKTWIDESKDFLLVDVLPPEYYGEKHIKGAVNAPVYEIAFLEYFEKLDVPKDKTIVVYNEDEKSLATEDAAIKLGTAGFQDVYEFVGGLDQWEEAGFEIEKGEVVAAPKMEDGTYQLDVENSIISWTGRNAKYAHHGKITAKGGSILVENGKVSSGRVVLDMATIKDEDLADEMWRGILENHLKSSDFFDTKKHGEASFGIRNAEVIAGALGGTPNYKMFGNLTIKDATRPFEFEALVAPMGGGVINGQTHFDFDRTLWNVRYGSEKFFEKLGMHLVNDIVSLELFLVVKK